MTDELAKLVPKGAPALRGTGPGCDRLIAPQIRLAAVIWPEVSVRGAAGARSIHGFHKGGDFVGPPADPPRIRLYTIIPDTTLIRPVADLDATLLHEIGHGLLKDNPEYEANALGAALAEYYEAELNAPLADVLDCFFEYYDDGFEEIREP